MTTLYDELDDDPRERPGYDDPEHCDPSPGAASGFEDDWEEDPEQPREWPEHDPEAQTKCHMGRV